MKVDQQIKTDPKTEPVGLQRVVTDCFCIEVQRLGILQELYAVSLRASGSPVRVFSLCGRARGNKQDVTKSQVSKSQRITETNVVKVRNSRLSELELSVSA